MEHFRAGDVVELVHAGTLAAKPGDLAVVVTDGYHYLVVNWLGTTEQKNGGYDRTRFRQYVPTPKMEDTRDYLKTITEL